jgi:hypothetical protein
VADDEHLVRTAREERVDIGDVVREVVVPAAADAVRLAEAAQVRCEDAEPCCGQRRRHEIEALGRIHEPVE